jgi:putative Holliday junction resolvase
MGLDVGDKFIGIAISDALHLTAQGRPTLKRSSLAADVQHLGRLAAENEVEEIVVGQPLHMDGRESAQSHKIARFARKLRESTGIPVTFQDERLTSFAAEQHLEEMGLDWRRRREHVDRVAAMLILQSYLDGRRS